MRSDMGKVIVERPRRGSRDPGIKTRLHISSAALGADWEDFDAGAPLGVRPSTPDNRTTIWGRCAATFAAR